MKPAPVILHYVAWTADRLDWFWLNLLFDAISIFRDWLQWRTQFIRVSSTCAVAHVEGDIRPGPNGVFFPAYDDRPEIPVEFERCEVIAAAFRRRDRKRRRAHRQFRREAELSQLKVAAMFHPLDQRPH